MSNQTFITISLLLIYYHLSGLSTTNILRLTKGNTQTILSPSCKCNACSNKIPPLLQLPIISYLLCMGKCRKCGAKIPIYPLMLEIFLFVGMTIITTFFNFSILGVTLSLLFYEICRIVTIAIKGKRETDFIKQLFIAVISMLPFYICVIFVALLYWIV